MLSEPIVAIDVRDLGHALRRKKAAASPAIQQAYDRASLMLISGLAWEYDPESELLTIESASLRGVRYTAGFLSCDCPRGKRGMQCKHQCAADLVYSATFEVRRGRR